MSGRPEAHLYAMPDALDQVWKVLPQRPLVDDGSRDPLGNLHLGARREIPDSPVQQEAKNVHRAVARDSYSPQQFGFPNSINP